MHGGLVCSDTTIRSHCERLYVCVNRQWDNKIADSQSGPNFSNERPSRAQSFYETSTAFKKNTFLKKRVDLERQISINIIVWSTELV